MFEEDLHSDQELPSVSGLPVKDELARSMLMEAFLEHVEEYPEHVTMQASWLYDRKGYPSQTPLDNPHNESYGSDSDDVLISFTVKVPGWHRPVGVDVNDRLLAVKKEQERLEAEQEVSELRKKLAEAERKIHELQ